VAFDDFQPDPRITKAHFLEDGQGGDQRNSGWQANNNVALHRVLGNLYGLLSSIDVRQNYACMLKHRFSGISEQHSLVGAIEQLDAKL